MISIIKFTFLFSISLVLYSKTPEEIIEGKKRAVLTIKTINKLTGKAAEIGGGFFIDSKGNFITNKHVLRTFLGDKNKYQLQIQNINGNEYSEVEIKKCGSKNNIDLCLLKTSFNKKIYFFDIIQRTASKSQQFALIGHNGENFSIKKGKIGESINNLDESFGLPKENNINTSMIELTDYDYASGTCTGDSGGPVFDIYTGDLYGVFTECKHGKTSGKIFKYAIDSKEVYTFINLEAENLNIKLSKDQIFSNSIPETRDERGREFEKEIRSGKLE